MNDSSTKTDSQDRYDVVIIGGAFSGAATAVMLKRWHPQTRVLLIERTEQFKRKVGEATVEVSGLFLTKVLGLTQALSRHHLPKHGLRFWFDHGQGQRLEDMGELGPNRLPGLASFHLDRSILDQQLIDLAEQLGVDIARPAKVTDIQCNWPDNRVTYTQKGQRAKGAKGPRGQEAEGPKSAGTEFDASPHSRVDDHLTQSQNHQTTKSPNHQVAHCRWLIDASGRNAFLGRRFGLMQKPQNHPIAAAWARWSDVADLDGQAVLGSDPCKPRLKRLKPSRSLSTNHFCGYGWWCWLIPLPGGQTSLGLVYDTRMFDPPGNGKIAQRYRDFVTSQPGLSQLLEHASMDQSDFYAYKHLPYRTGQYMDKGWAIVGDAAAFLDPLYSSGLDHAAISSFATARIIDRDLAGQSSDDQLRSAITEHNAAFDRSYDRWLEAIYQDKYALFGDPQLVAASYFLDIGSYYLGVVSPVYRDLINFRDPVLGKTLPQAKIAYHLMRTIKRRFISLARTRRRLGITQPAPDPTASQPNQPQKTPASRVRRRYPQRIELGLGAIGLMIRGTGIWLKTELTTLPRHLTTRPGSTPANPPAQAQPTTETQPSA